MQPISTPAVILSLCIVAFDAVGFAAVVIRERKRKVMQQTLIAALIVLIFMNSNFDDKNELRLKS